MQKPGDIFGRYAIEAAIGQGGMGRVYRAHDERLGRRVALKVLSDAAGDEGDARLLREARAAAALDHPNAIAIYDVGEVDGAAYIVMELVEGRTLRDVIDDVSVPLAIRVSWLTDAARALAAAHRRGLVHRDIKPENVMVRDDGVVKVLDFGIARRSGTGVDPNGSTQVSALPTLTLEGIKLGTPVYMAPEQVRGEPLDGRADQFAWGVLAYELFTGKLPWRGSDALAVVASILTDTIDPAPLTRAQVPDEVRAVLLRALEKRPADRFASMDDLVRALDAAQRGEAPSGPRVLPPERAPSATSAQRFSTEEVSEVLGRAIDQQVAKAGDTRLGFDDLRAAAREVGVDTAAVRDASRALRTRDEAPIAPAASASEAASWIRRRRLAFHRHAGIYVIVNAAIAVLGVMFGVMPYALIPALLWGIGVAIHGLVALTSNQDDWAENEEQMRWWRDQRQRRHEVALARYGKKAGARFERVEARRPRIEALTSGPKAKLRVAADPSEEEAAEAEEEAHDEGRSRKRRNH